MRCPTCGANIEVTVYADGSILSRRDCNCKAQKEQKKKFYEKTYKEVLVSLGVKEQKKEKKR